jgi:hypothetical protein
VNPFASLVPSVVHPHPLDADGVACVRFGADLGLVRDDSEWPPLDREPLWGIPVGDGLVRVANVPLFAVAFAYGDTVVLAQGDDLPLYLRTALSGGYAVFRVILDGALPEVDRWFVERMTQSLRDLGCTVEFASPLFFGIAMPPSASEEGVRDILAMGEEDGIWSYDEGHAPGVADG